MSRTRNAGLAAGLLLAVLVGYLRAASFVPAMLLVGAGATVGAEALAYQRPVAVRALFDRPIVLAGAGGLALSGILVGALIGPDGSLSFAAGALGTYLLLLAVAHAIGWAPANDS